MITNFFTSKKQAIRYKRQMVRETKQQHTVIQTIKYIENGLKSMPGYMVRLGK